MVHLGPEVSAELFVLEPSDVAPSMDGHVASG
jgi:hypothetical protein